MSILINGMEMPEDGSWKTIRIYPDGTCAVPNWQGDCTLIKGAQAISVPPHGRLIDADVLEQECQKRLLVCTDRFQRPYEVLRAIALAPTIILAEEGE